MKSNRDYAKTENMNFWLRHPVLGDPSFDTFERIGDTVHVSEPPYEWAVNGSIFRDFDGAWYYYAGLYHSGYGRGEPSRFKIYKSVDRGQSWEDLGYGFNDKFRFEGNTADTENGADCVICYDEKKKKYLLTYDNSTNDFTWEDAHNPNATADAGASLAWSDSPAGPFERLPSRFVSDKFGAGCCGKFDRYYASTVLPRENDYIAFVLTDSGEHFAWGLVAMTAPSPEGPWSKPHMILSPDRPEYYPCPVEFYPAEVHNGIVYCSATSVARNRNYQAVFEAPLEKAHDPAAWKLTEDGNIWHARDLEDEYYGIWGQTYHGFIEPDTGKYVVMFPSKDKRDYGCLSVAARPWDTPHSDGFTLTGHGGASISPLLNSYRDFNLEAEFSFKGSIDIAFGYNGILGPDDSCADSVPSEQTLSDYSAIRFTEKKCSVVSVDRDGNEKTLAERNLLSQSISLSVCYSDGKLNVNVNEDTLCTNLYIEQSSDKTAPLALIAQTFSRIDCTKFAVYGESFDYTYCYNAVDALLGAGQFRPNQEIFSLEDEIAPDFWRRTADGYVGEGLVWAKWNVIGSIFELPFKKSPALGTIGIWVDGTFNGSADLCGEGETKFITEKLDMGRHSIRVAPLKGKIAISRLTVKGNAQDLI